MLAFSGGLLLGSLRRRRKREEAAQPVPREAPVPAAARTGRFTPSREREATAVAAASRPSRPAAPPVPRVPSPPARPQSVPAARPQSAPAARVASPAARPQSAPAARVASPAARPQSAPAARVASPGARPQSAPARPAGRAVLPPARLPSAPPAPPAPVFAPRVRWPAGSEKAWRCEITWRSGYRRSEFRALAGPPGAKRKTVVAESRPFKNLVKDPADIPRPELASAVRELMIALEAQGWTPVAPGGRWYSRRFVWTHDGPPPGVEGAV